MRSLVLNTTRCAVISACLVAATAGAQSADGARAMLATGQYEEAAAALSSLGAGTGALCPGPQCDVELVLVSLWMTQGRYDEAIALSRAVHDRLPAPAVAATTAWGEALLRRGRLDEAEATFDTAIGESDAHRARLLLGRLLMQRGREDEARPLLRGLIAAYNDETIPRGDAEGLSYVAIAAWLLDSPHDANDAFQESARADRRRLETQLEWAEHFMLHHDLAHAEASVRDALAINPRSPEALVLSARLVLQQSMDFTTAEARLTEALAINPSLVSAHVTRASIALRDQDLLAADGHLDLALAINPLDHGALSARAAVRFVGGETRAFERALSAVHTTYPRDTDVFTLVSEHADWEHRYEEEVALARRALAIDPRDARSLTTLGTNLLRTGEETEGIEVLGRAFARDRFDVRVLNTLNFYERVITPHYEWIDARPFRIRVHHDERALLDEIVPPLVDEAYRSLRRRYGVTPRAPLFLELYASQAHFAVRTSGLPNLGVQGVCFGRVVTALSPRGGPFDWAQITWHELSHVFHLALSRNRVPRWLTEGLAELETTVARPAWAREDDHRLYLMLTSGRLPPLAEMNEAFTHARSAQAMLDAYYASTRIAAFLVDHFGMRRVVALLREYGRGRSGPEAFQRALRTPIEEVDRLFREAELSRMAGRSDDFAVDLLAYADRATWAEPARANPTDARARAEHAAALLVTGDGEVAQREAEAAIAIDASEPFARFVLMQVALARRAGAEVRAQATALIGAGHDGYAVRLAEARAAIGGDDVATARASLLRATQIDPVRIDAWMALDALAVTAHDEALRRTTLEHRVAIEQHDREGLAAYLLVLDAAGDHAAIAALEERARFGDPYRVENHRIILRALMALGERRRAESIIDLLEALGASDVAELRASLPPR
jgi:tetratricopeptide (TPR) repeat protein